MTTALAARRDRRVSHFPAGVALEFQRELRKIIDELIVLTMQYIEAQMLPALIRAGVRMDAPTDELRVLLEGLYQRMVEAVPEARALEIARRAVTQAQLRALEQFRREVARAKLGDVGIEIVIPPGRMHEISEARVAEIVRLIKTIPDHLSEEVERLVFEAAAQGTGYAQLSRSLKELADVTRARAKVIAVDQINRVYSGLARERMSALGVQHVIWLTAEDERTCTRCAPLHGRRFRLDVLHEQGQPPLHPVCRCTIIADEDELREIARRSW